MPPIAVYKLQKSARNINHLVITNKGTNDAGGVLISDAKQNEQQCV
jgi:hypothetical protein